MMRRSKGTSVENHEIYIQSDTRSPYINLFVLLFLPLLLGLGELLVGLGIYVRVRQRCRNTRLLLVKLVRVFRLVYAQYGVC